MPQYLKPVILNLFIVCAVMLAPYLSEGIKHQYSMNIDREYSPIKDIPGWKYTNKMHDEIVSPKITTPDYKEEGQYSSGNKNIEVYVYAYTNAADNKEIIKHENVIYQSQFWTKAKQSNYELVTDDGKSYILNEFLVYRNNSKRIIRYFYLINGQYVVRASKVKFNELLVKLKGVDIDSSLFVFSADVSGDYLQASEALNDVIAKVLVQRNI